MRRYYCKMSDDSVINLLSPSAAQALCTALETCLGRTVKECWSGDHERRPSKGFTEFEVPPHEAVMLPPSKRTRTPTDHTVTMFDDAPRRSRKEAGAHQDAP